MILQHQARSFIETQIKTLETLLNTLKDASNDSDKLAILNRRPGIVEFLASSPILEELVSNLEIKKRFVIKALLAIGQGPVVFQDLQSVTNPKKLLDLLALQLLEIEKFYDLHGGIIGYQLTLLKLLANKEKSAQKQPATYKKPPGIDLSSESEELKKAIRWGIDFMPVMGEMYPLGGAGDRLNLKDEVTGELLPAAQLLFCGRTLLELLIRDLLGREFLYYKLFGKQLVTPLAIMTSHEKNNHNRIQEICKTNEWFGRPKDSFRLFLQPLVPMVTVDGDWAVSQPMQLILKPGGHGVIWKAALDNGVFDWLASRQTKKILVRQINNPIAGVDSGLLALLGIGCQKNKDFGFASCHRLIAAAEGMNVLREVKDFDSYEYCITNIEYTEFKQFGIEDVPEKSDSPFSCFPANTNILFADLAAIAKTARMCSIPGILINLKSRVACYTSGGLVEKLAGRLESTMQNIADYMTDRSPKKLTEKDTQNLRTFLTYNERRKTISVAKQSYSEEKPLSDTPEGCFYDLIKNYRDLLINYCLMNLPSEQDEAHYLANGPDCIVLFHPALGTLYSVIKQKIQGGTLAIGSEWILEISETEIINLDLDGSLIIEAESVMGKKDLQGTVAFNADQCGKCTLINVKVRNLGRVRTSGRNVWKCQTERKEALWVTLQGNAEFFAENVELVGNIHFDVPEGHRLVVYQQGKEIAWHFEKINHASWHWDYFFEEDNRISLQKVRASYHN